MPRYNIFIDLTQIFVFMVLRCQCLFQCFIIFLKTIRLFICLFSPSLSSLGNHFLHFLPIRMSLSPITEKKLVGNSFQTEKDAIESCSLLPALTLCMYQVARLSVIDTSVHPISILIFIWHLYPVLKHTLFSAERGWAL